MHKFLIYLLILIAFVDVYNAYCSETEMRAVLISARIDSSTPQKKIVLSWANNDTNATEYVINRRMNGMYHWTFVQSLDPSVNTYTDSILEDLNTMEYQIVKKTYAKYQGYGYIFVGYDVQPKEYKGTALVFIDETMVQPLRDEFNRFVDDLYGDGYSVIRYDVPRTDNFNPYSVEKIKDIVEREYKRNIKSPMTLILLGRIAVPYSGSTAWDGHVPDHLGAWPTDLYYTTEPLYWTDVDVIATKAQREENRNLPHDGKFDQSVIGFVRFPTGRVDFHNLPAFKESETELMKRYLNKNHDFRTAKMKPIYRAVIDDGWGMYARDAFAATAWMNFASLLGRQNIDTAKYLSILSEKNYIWSYGGNMGSYNSMYQTIYTDQLAVQSVKGIFTSYLGSWLGDWDGPDNVMRAAIASEPSILACIWNGIPFWFLHHMGLGESIGYSSVVSINNVNNSYTSTSENGGRGIQMNVIGDPTLRLKYPDQPTGLHINNSYLINEKTIFSLGWNPSPDSVIGYNLYRYSIENNKYTRVNQSIITDTTFTDTLIGGGNQKYMLRSVQLEHNNSGSYYNLSQGAFISTGKIIADATESHTHIGTYCTPNPVSETLNIYTDIAEDSQIDIMIFNASGILVFHNIYPGYKGDNHLNIDLSMENTHLPNGIYIAEIKNNQNRKALKFSLFR